MKLDPTGCIDTYNGQGYFQVRDNWEGKGYRLYYGDDDTVSQVDGEINGKVFRTIADAKAHCLRRFKLGAKRVYN
jgi:hypothetical protein